LSFNQFRLSSDILQGLKDVQIETPSSLQKKILKAVKGGTDVQIAASLTDKPEIGYLVMMLDDIAKSERRQGVRAVIVAPTEDRAKEIDEWVWAVGYHAGIESACITDSGKQEEQLSAISAGPVIIVATPGRLTELLESSRMVMREVNLFVIDEADAIENWPAVHAISKRIIGRCQRIISSKSLNKQLEGNIAQFLKEPEVVVDKAVAKEKAPAETKEKAPAKKESAPKVGPDLTQYYINVPPRSKITTLINHLDKTPADNVLIFAASPRTADRLYKVMRKSGRRAVSIHNTVDKAIFDERFERFTSGDVQHLIVAGISAAELNIGEVAQVINYDVPEEVDEYRLRAELIGDGKAARILSLVSKQDRSDIHEIIKELGYAPEEIPLPESVEKKQEKEKSDNRGKEKEQSRKPSADKGRQQRPQSRDRGNGNKGRGGRPNDRSGRGKQHGRGRGNEQQREFKPEGLPRPTFDQLSGGRSGHEKKKPGVLGFFKKIFGKD
jgi:superfamily II DNA/RNA helicase